MLRQDIPDEYAVIQLADRQWYPVRVVRIYSCFSPDGFTLLDFFSGTDEKEMSYPRKMDATVFCQQQAAQEQRWEREHWEHVAMKSEVYPERCVHYREIIQEITGYAPLVSYLYGGVQVYIPEYHCPYCTAYHPLVVKEALITEDVLEACAEYVYATQQRCVCACLSQEIVLSSTGG